VSIHLVTAARGPDSYWSWKAIVAFLQISRICSSISDSLRKQRNHELSAQLLSDQSSAQAPPMLTGRRTTLPLAHVDFVVYGSSPYLLVCSSLDSPRSNP
jgi:hypothetical protein